MRNIQIVHAPVFPENPTNPARAYLDSNVIEINDTAFYALPKEHQSAILKHEYGHLVNNTRSEIQADSYAIEQSNRKDSESLVKTMKALESVGSHDEDRMQAAFTKSLTVAARRGNKKAAKLLGITANANGEKSSNTRKNIFLIVGIISLFLLVLYKLSR